MHQIVIIIGASPGIGKVLAEVETNNDGKLDIVGYREGADLFLIYLQN